MLHCGAWEESNSKAEEREYAQEDHLLNKLKKVGVVGGVGVVAAIAAVLTFALVNFDTIQKNMKLTKLSGTTMRP